MSTRHKRAIPQQIALLLLAILTWYPLVFMVSTSLKTQNQFYENYWWFAFPFDFANYQVVWGRISIAIMNSMQYSLGTLALVLILSLLGGYAFGRFKFYGKNVLFMGVIMLLMIPGTLTLVPLFVQTKALGMANSAWGIIFPLAGFEIVIGIFIMRLFFERLPLELFQAARIEGANQLQLLIFVAIPLALPGLGTVAILDLLFTWNELLWPLVVLSDQDAYPVSAAAITFKNQYRIDNGNLFAAYVSVSIPLMILFIFVVRKFIRGIEGI